MILNNRIWLHAPAILAAASALYAGIAWGARSALPWLVVAVVALAVAWWVERRLARPLARLGEAARQLVEGGDIGPLGEVGEARPLAEALNTIDARLTSQDKEIATLKDAKRQALTELQSAEERYVAAVSGADDGLWD